MAQLVEQLIRNQQVASSSLAISSIEIAPSTEGAISMLPKVDVNPRLAVPHYVILRFAPWRSARSPRGRVSDCSCSLGFLPTAGDFSTNARNDVVFERLAGERGCPPLPIRLYSLIRLAYTIDLTIHLSPEGEGLNSFGFYCHFDRSEGEARAKRRNPLRKELKIPFCLHCRTIARYDARKCRLCIFLLDPNRYLCYNRSDIIIIDQRQTYNARTAIKLKGV